MTEQEKAVIAASREWANASEARRDEMAAGLNLSYDGSDRLVASIYNRLLEEIKRRTNKQEPADTDRDGKGDGRGKKEPLSCHYTTRVDSWTYNRLRKLAEEKAQKIAGTAREIVVAGVAQNLDIQKPPRMVDIKEKATLNINFTLDEAMRIQAAAGEKGWSTGTFCRAVIETEIRRQDAEEREKNGHYTLGFTTEAWKVRAFQRYAKYVGEYPSKILNRWLTDFLSTTEIPTEEQAAEAEEKRRAEKENVPSDKQKRLIWCIENELGIKFNGATKADAMQWIGTYKPQLDKKKAASDESKER